MPWSTLTSPGGPCSILAPLAAQSSGRSGLFRSMTVRSTALSSTKAKRTSLLVRFALDSPLEGGVTCELVSGNPDFNVRKKENGRPKAKFDQYLDLV